MLEEIMNPKFIIAYTIIVGFAAAYVFNPSETMNGALIAAFAGAWGFYLGSSNSSNQVREQVGKALDLAAAVQPALPPPGPQKVNLEGTITSAPDRAEFETDSGYRPLASTSDDPPVVPSLGGSGQRPDGATTAMDE